MRRVQRSTLAGKGAIRPVLCDCETCDCPITTFYNQARTQVTLPNLNVGNRGPQNNLVGPIWRCCGTFAKSGNFRVQKNGTSGTQTKICDHFYKAKN